MPTQALPTTTAADNASKRNRTSLICRDLDDIYLMLDHLSGRADKNVSALTVEVDSAGDDPAKPPSVPTVLPGTSVTRKNLIQSVCAIEGWPPEREAKYTAIAATTLFKARDILNEIAWPASGMTIAYTIMVTDLSNAVRSPSGQRTRGGRQPAPTDNSGIEPGQPGVGPSPVVDGTTDDEEDAARTSLAISAYPHLLRPARKLRKWIVGYIFMLIGVLAVTAVLSWNVAAGKLVIERLNELKLRETMESARVVSAEGEPGAIVQAVSTSTDDVPDAGYVFDTLCGTDGTALPPNTGAAAVPSSASSVRLNSLCGKGLAILDQRFAADASLRQWFGPWKRITSWGEGLDAEKIAQPDKPINNRTRIRNAALMEQQAGDVNSVLASYVLPILYGLLGATTAVIRNLNGKMRESTLAPRDLRVSQVQLALGIIVGACIGLFLSPTGTPDVRLPNVTLAGNGVSLTASALSFIAGFGVEAVFKWLEVIINIAFAAGGAAANQHVSPPPRRDAHQA